MANLKKLNVKGPVGQLQAELTTTSNARNDYVALVLHPHPLFGGTMDNKVVTTLVRTFRDLDIPVLRFNFRGVGNSEGQHDDGNGEQADAIAAANWLLEEFPQSKLLLAGFSFGAATAVRVANTLNPALLVSCAAPASYFASGDSPVNCPWLALHGEQDEVAPWPAAETWLATHPNAPVVASKPKVGHFFHGELSWLRDTVSGFITAHLE